MNSAPPIQSPTPHRTPWAWHTATLFGVGFLRPGPGTYGSLAAVLWWMLAAKMHPAHLALYTAIAAVAVIAIGIPAATIVAREHGRKDPQFVVIDEVAGQLIALIAARPDWRHSLLAFALFRAFDILKPPPCRQLERLPSGTGIMMDDVAAGLYALAAALLLTHWL